MNDLNIAYLLAVFQATVAAKENNSYAIVPADSDEVAALVKAKYIKTNKKLHNADGNVGAVLVEGATEADLRVDFEIPDFPVPAGETVAEPAPEAAPAAPFQQELAPEAPAVQSAPLAATEPQPEAYTAPAEPAPYIPPVSEAPVIQEETISAPFGHVMPEAATQTQPTTEFTAMTEQLQQSVELQPATEQYIAPAASNEPVAAVGAAPVVETDGVKIIGDTDYEVATVAHTRKGDVEIDVGVPFITKVSKPKREKKGTGVEHYPFNDIAEFKLQNPSSAPSFHVAGKAVKDMSNSVRRASDRFEAQGSQVTFRAMPAAENDPKGEGVRVFALFIHEAPEQRRSNRKKKDDAAETAE